MREPELGSQHPRWSAVGSTALTPAAPPPRPLLPRAIQIQTAAAHPGGGPAQPQPQPRLWEGGLPGGCFCLRGVGFGSLCVQGWTVLCRPPGPEGGLDAPSRGPGWLGCGLCLCVARGPRPWSLSGAHARPPAGVHPALPGSRGTDRVSPLPAFSAETSSPTTFCWMSEVSRGSGPRGWAPLPHLPGRHRWPLDSLPVLAAPRTRAPDRLQHRHHREGRGEGDRAGGDQAVHG